MKAIKRAAVWVILSIWIIAALGCAGANTANHTTEPEEKPLCWAGAQLQGGSGKAFVETPCPIYDIEGMLYAQITWSSNHYDYMVVHGEKILPTNTEGNSQFMVPLGSAKEIIGESDSVKPDTAEENTDTSEEQTEALCAALSGTTLVLDVQADTTAMSTPHLIDYTISLDFYKSREDAESSVSAGTGKTEHAADAAKADEENATDTAKLNEEGAEVGAPNMEGFTFLSKDENAYAECFDIYRYEGGYAVLSVDDGRRYLIVPKGGTIPQGMDEQEDLFVLQQPLDRIYLAASAAMCQFDEIGAVQNVILSGLQKEDWYIASAREAMEQGTLSYGGKYSEPDYEKIVDSGVNLAIESTMILHSPKVKEKLELLGIPVLIDRSSYESEPLGRAEWVKVYGLLTGHEEEAEQAFEEQTTYVEELPTTEENSVSLAVFAINAARQVVTRSSDGYLSKMVDIAGGTLCTPVTDSGAATETVSMEAFYAAAEDADILIYNASIEDAPQDLSQLCAKDPILTQFRAVSEGNVWCMRSSLYQNASRTGAILRDLHVIVAGEAGDETEFFFRLK